MLNDFIHVGFHYLISFALLCNTGAHNEHDLNDFTGCLESM